MGSMSEITEYEDQSDLSRADQILIGLGWVRLYWLPYAVLALGVTLSLIFSLVLYIDTYVNFEFINIMQECIHWIILTLGLIFSILISVLIRAAQVMRRQSIHLKIINDELKKEIREGADIRESKTKLEHALLQGQKLQAMGTLAGGIAHDFNNILYAIIGYTEMAREDVSKDIQLHGNMGKVLEACQRGQELVSRILTFSRRQHHQLDQLDLKPTIENVLSLLNQTIPSSVQIEFIMNEDIDLCGNKTLLHQILVNIINNAVDAMDGEGTIKVEVTRILQDDPYLRQFPDIVNTNFCKIEISDTGHGMNKDTIERIFEPFYTTKDVGKGTGLGLSIVHTIIKDHKGEIAVTSELGKGTTFTLLLPEYQQP